MDGASVRVGLIKTKVGLVYGISTNKDEIKSSRLFLSELTAIGKSLGHLTKIKIENKIK